MTNLCQGPLAGLLLLRAKLLRAAPVWAVLLWTVLLWAALAPLAQAAELDLSGAHKITLDGDAPQFAAPGFDDSAWRSIALPGSLRSQGFKSRPDVFWYRIRFHVPSDWAAPNPAFRLGVIDRSDEAYLNGVRIGGLGQIGPRLSDWHAFAPIQPRLYPAPPGLLIRGAENVLALRIAREPYIDDGGLLSGPVALLDLTAALPEHLAQVQRFAVVTYTLLGIETLTLGVVLFLALFRDTRRSSQLFALLFACYYFGSLERRGVLDALGVEGPGLQFAANALPGLCIPLMMSFVARIYVRKMGVFARAVQFGLVAALVSVPLTGVPLLEWWAMESTVLWHALLVVALGLMLVWSVAAAHQQRPHARALLVGLGLLGASLLADMLLPADYFETTFGVRLGEVGVLALLLSLCHVFGARVLGLKSALLQANAEILSAQEQERSRLARDVHDSVGQWLSAVKIKIDLLSASHAARQPIAAESLTALAADVDSALEETRRVAKDLSPVVLEGQGLVEGMRDLTTQMAARADLVISLDAPAAIELPVPQRNQVFRIFQEALRNAVTHSGATGIDVTMLQRAGQWRLSVHDNGRGLPDPDAKGGTGLASMRNRALLLHGALEVASEPGEGTRVLLSFPVPKRGATHT